MGSNRLFWLLDEVAAKTHPTNWDKLLGLSSKLISIMGNKELEHEIVNPLESFRKLYRELTGLPVSTIIDISGWLGYGLKPLFPDAELISDFSISRVMDISSKDSTTAGFVINQSQDEVRRKSQELNLSSVLIIDDATVSGRTNRVVMGAWGLEPTKTTHASLLVNIGDYLQMHGRQIKHGAKILLEGLGSKVIYGDVMISPQDDANHLLDIFQHPYLEKVLLEAMRIRRGKDSSWKWGEHTEQLRYAFPGDESHYLFPHQLSSLDLMQLASQGRFVRNSQHVETENSFYCKNPLLWAYNDFWEYTDEASLKARQDDVLDILNKFKELTGVTHNIFEARQALQRETENLISKKTVEGIITRREREI